MTLPLEPTQTTNQEPALNPAIHPNADMHDFQVLDDVPAQSFVKKIDYEHIIDTLAQVPQAFRRSLLDEYERLYSAYQNDETLQKGTCRDDANRYFDHITNYVKDQTFLNHSDDNLRTKAKRYALAVIRLIGSDANYFVACEYAENRGIEIPHKKSWRDLFNHWQFAHQRLDQHLNVPSAEADEQQINLLKQASQYFDTQWKFITVRLSDEQWWIRQLIKLHDRQFEQAAIRFACVRKHRQVYISDTSLDKILSRQQRSLEIMEGLIAVSDEGDEVEMLDILKGSAANPVIRRAELMNRLHGFEQYAEHHQHIAEFYTLTAPSKYHPNSAKYNHFTPRETQQEYFSPLWARVRSKFKDNGLSVYGFRIAEPHCDACPHWHILLFISPHDHLDVRNILKEYALQEEGDEAGAAENRFDYEKIDKEKGSAIGYIAKYISKNIDGFGMDKDKTDDGSDLAINQSAQRVRAWSSIWGIRQFQQIGGSSISIWRELRRLKDQQQTNETIEAARKAANSGDWKAYLEAQGGTHIPMRNQPIQLYHQVHCDKNTGVLHTNQYGEIVYRIEGIQTHANDEDETKVQVITRLKQWVIQDKPAEELAEQDDLLLTTSTETAEEAIQRLLKPKHCLDLHSASLAELEPSTFEADFLNPVAFDLPWSSVNNCRNLDLFAPESEKSPLQSAKDVPNKQAISSKKSGITPKSTQKLDQKTS